MPWVRHAIRWMLFVAATTGWTNGATIANQATLHYRSGTAPFSVQSNRVEDPIVDSNDTNGSGTVDPNQRLKLTKTAHYASHQLYKGSVVDYTIRIEALSDQPVQSAVFVDTIPSGTSFVPGSVTLDGQAKDDANVFDGSAVRIALPDMNQGDVHTVKFRVRVNK